MKPARHKDQLSLPPMPVRNTEGHSTAFRKAEDEPATFGQPEDGGYRIASELFDAAMCGLEARGRLTNKDVAFLCGVSTALVEKWRQLDTRACPSFAQMLLLPPAFHIELHRAMNRKYGFGRAALARLLEAASDLALVVE